MGTIRDRVGFVLHSADLYNHYRNVVLLMNRPHVEFVLLASIGDSKRRLEERLSADGMSFVDYEHVRREGWKYRFLVTNHIMGKSAFRPYLPELIGHYNIRFMYAMGKARHNFAAWNEIYDAILCHGPYQVERLAFCRSAVKLQMGYPRYDGYDDAFTRRRDIRERLGVYSERPLVLWMPTWQGLSSVESYLASVSTLTENYDVLVKPHPLTVTLEPERFALLRESGLSMVADEHIDITELYAAADCVLADYGGSIFSALYVDKPIVLLDAEHGAPGEDEFVGMDSPDVVVRESLPHVTTRESSQLLSVVSAVTTDEGMRATRDELRRRYFAPYRGSSARIAAAYLDNMEQILAGRRPSTYVRATRARIRAIARRELSLRSVGESVSSFAGRKVRSILGRR